MREYTVTYIDKNGDDQKFDILAPDSRVAIDSTLELRKDCKRVIACRIKPMFEDE